MQSVKENILADCYWHLIHAQSFKNMLEKINSRFWAKVRRQFTKIINQTLKKSGKIL